MPVDPAAKPISLAAMTARGQTATLPTLGPFARMRAAVAAEAATSGGEGGAPATTANAADPPAAAPALAPLSPDLPAISVNGLTFCYPDLGEGGGQGCRRRGLRP